MRALLLLLVATAAQAQPRAGAVVDAWRSGWERAWDDAESLEVTERSQHTFEGPRGTRDVEITAEVVYRAGQRPTRTVRRVEVDGRELDPERSPDMGRRIGRAFGRGARTATRPAPLPDWLMARAEARDLTAVRLDGADAWRVVLVTEMGSATAWFTRSAQNPRLLALRTERDEGRIAREIRYVRVDGLDLPARLDASVTARQRRRLRDYVVTLTVSTVYTAHALR